MAKKKAKKKVKDISVKSPTKKTAVKKTGKKKVLKKPAKKKVKKISVQKQKEKKSLQNKKYKLNAKLKPLQKDLAKYSNYEDNKFHKFDGRKLKAKTIRNILRKKMQPISEKIHKLDLILVNKYKARIKLFEPTTQEQIKGQKIKNEIRLPPFRLWDWEQVVEYILFNTLHPESRIINFEGVNIKKDLIGVKNKLDAYYIQMAADYTQVFYIILTRVTQGKNDFDARGLIVEGEED